MLSHGKNHYNSRNISIGNSTHAEVACLNKLTNNIKSIDLIILRVKSNGTLGNSKPCSGCMIFMLKNIKLRKLNIVNIYYSNEFGNIIKTTLNKLESLL